MRSPRRGPAPAQEAVRVVLISASDASRLASLEPVIERTVDPGRSIIDPIATSGDVRLRPVLLVFGDDAGGGHEVVASAFH